MYVSIFAYLISLLITSAESEGCQSWTFPSICTCQHDQQLFDLICSISDLSQLSSISNTRNSPHVSSLTIYLQNIHSLPSSTFSGFTSLNTLNIDGDDKLKYINRYAFLEFAEKLLYLNLRNTRLQLAPTEVISELKNLIWLTLENNLITSLEHLEDTHLEHVNARNNRISTIQHQRLPHSLKVLDLSKNYLAILNGSLRENFTKLQTVNVSFNVLSRLAGELEDVTNLKYLYAQGNVIANIENNTFHKLTILERLDLSYNRIEDIVDGIKELHNLKQLRLNNNLLKSLHRTAFIHLTALEILKLNNNQLSNLETGLFDYLISLQELDISYNNFIQLDFLSDPSATTSDNNFRNYETLKWLNIKGSGVRCSYVVNRTIQYILSKNVEIEGSPCPILL